ncbi:MAG: hypothetical protein JO223_16135 [Hyphomicrobiales bacterium]|nr:hypothetical protein [Hyphomicrobiales bacterium]
MPNSVLFRLVVSSAIVSSIIGGIYAYFVHDAWRTGVALGAVFGAAVPALEAFGFQGRIGPDLRRLPFLVYLGLRSAAYLAVIVVIEALIVRLLNGPQPVTVGDIAFGLAVSLAGNLMFGMAELLGPGVLIAFVVGRYHRPRREERALLFIDLTASTATAERLGETRFLDFLSAFVADVSQAVVENRGEIHKYVGDEIIATWRLRPDRNDAGIVRACFAARDRARGRSPRVSAGLRRRRRFPRGAARRARHRRRNRNFQEGDRPHRRRDEYDCAYSRCVSRQRPHGARLRDAARAPDRFCRCGRRRAIGAARAAREIRAARSVCA